MDKDQARRALDAWFYAIREFFMRANYPCELSIEEAAAKYGTCTSTPKDLQATSEFFDWDAITSFLEQHSTMKENP